METQDREGTIQLIERLSSVHKNQENPILDSSGEPIGVRQLVGLLSKAHNYKRGSFITYDSLRDAHTDSQDFAEA